ncbi:PucR family transcriptional regulator [Microbacterium esteraromaticum]|uniref:PucR family transcriptional regulator n=1 Tax=Microbacterium esteraromaticum TaxID=57043 RepID=A0A7D7WAZ7_9MICO|nr:PucR family transcriptional regulator [Microbacterium esteraromaticum]QMU96119.1 PucR family transcriptional regulator [Microbacterium esteraromaticum]
METAAAPTLRTLLGHAELRLSLVSPEESLADGALDLPVRWVHSSDLVDPTPFLADDLVLLTTGSQFADRDAPGADAYVERLVRRGVLALGFGSGVHRVGPSDELVTACAGAGLALFEVPYDIPFLAIARAHAESMAAHAYARRTWALEVQRALAVAALRPRGLEATLTELARRLGCWVGLFDSSGATAQQHPAALDGGADAVSDAVADLLARGTTASRSLDEGDRTVTLFTFGRTGQLKGVIGVDLSPIDAEARAVITTAIAMAGLALEQSEQLARGRRRMHTQLLASLRADDPSLARRTLGAMPPAPMLVATADAAPVDAVVGWFERQRAVGGTVTFVAEDADGLTICIGASSRGLLDQVSARFDIRIGVSEPAEYTGFSHAHAQAMTALQRSGREGVIEYHDVQPGGVLDALVSSETRTLARTRLATLRAHDATSGTELERTLRAWLEHDTHAEQTAAVLGIHRHTLRTRIAQAANLLGTDLTSFPARAELWATLRAAE